MEKLEMFKEAKKLALTIRKGTYRRPSADNCYMGCKSTTGRMFVIGDTEADIQNPDCIINGKPAREIFGDFTIMSRC